MKLDPKPFEEYDIDIKIEYCGICGSDLHTLRSGWVGLFVPTPPLIEFCIANDLFFESKQGPTMYPIVVGHEIVGKAVRIGSKVTEVQVGDTVGVGANSWSCGTCKSCKDDSEQYCVRPVLEPPYSRTWSFRFGKEPDKSTARLGRDIQLQV